MLTEAMVLETLQGWLEVSEHADGIHAGLPVSIRAAIEASGVVTADLATHFATLPSEERAEARRVLVRVLEMLQGGSDVSEQQACARRRPDRCRSSRVS